MKFLVLVLVVVAVLWLLRSQSRRDLPAAPAAPGKPAVPAGPAHEDVVACAYCGLHLPRSEALACPEGVFCGEVHRLAQEQRNKTP